MEMATTHVIFCLMMLYFTSTSATKEKNESYHMQDQARLNAWESFFRSFGECSDDEDFAKKVAYADHEIRMVMHKKWDEEYVRKLLFFPIYHFKNVDEAKFIEVTKNFLKVLENPFAFHNIKNESNNRPGRSKRALISIGGAALGWAVNAFGGFLGDIAVDAFGKLLGFGDDSDGSKVQDVSSWKDMTITDLEERLRSDKQFMRRFRNMIEDYSEYFERCEYDRGSLTLQEYGLCKLVRQYSTGAITKSVPMVAFTAIMITFFFQFN